MAEPRLRIVQIFRAPIGGLFRHVADLTEQLADRGHALGLVVDSLTSDAQTAARLERLKSAASLGIHAMPMPRVFGPADLFTPVRLTRLLARLEADIVHGHGAKGGFYARLAAGGRVASLYTPHGGVLHFDPGSPAGKIFHFLERRLIARTAAMIFESEFARQSYERQIGTPKRRAEVIHNGLAPSEFVPVSPRLDAAEFAFVGELRRLKGIFQLVEAVDLLRAQGRPLRVVIAGDGPDRVELGQRIAALGLGDCLTLLGVRPARAVFELGRCVLVPSLAESLPYVVLEAAAARRPIIATKVGGIAEIFGPTSPALIEPGNARALAEAMRRQLDQPEALAGEAVERFSYIAGKFSLERMTDEIAALYAAVKAQT